MVFPAEHSNTVAMCVAVTNGHNLLRISESYITMKNFQRTSLPTVSHAVQHSRTKHDHYPEQRGSVMLLASTHCAVRYDRPLATLKLFANRLQHETLSPRLLQKNFSGRKSWKA